MSKAVLIGNIISAVPINPHRAVCIQEKSQYLFIIIDGVSIHEIETQNYESA